MVYEMLNPNPDIRGRGEWRLEEGGIEAGKFDHDLVKAIRSQNADFIEYMQGLGLRRRVKLLVLGKLSFMMDVPHGGTQMGAVVGVCHWAGQSETAAPERTPNCRKSNSADASSGPFAPFRSRAIHPR
jgi:hypothetical protein